MTEAFNDWWDGDIQPTDNPYRQDSAAYWAWEGWKAGVKAEREACAEVCEYYFSHGARDIAAAIRARGQG
jgi:hypothetical protein